ncbi:MAG: chemotaxis protein, partial [Bdellovibrionia bacterium]
MSDLTLEKLRSLIYQKTGMLFEEKKDYYLKSRIKERMEATGTKTVTEYYQKVAFSSQEEELQKFIEALTIKETYLFRDFPQLQGFAEKVLPPYLIRKQES